jgi:hypothetical protein
MALPFVELSDIVKYYDAAVAKLSGNLCLENFNFLILGITAVEFEDDFLSYIESTWIGIPSRGRRRLPRFRHEWWNLHASVASNEPRTNNSAEGWHNAFHSSLGSNHPTIFKFIDAIKLEQGRSEAQIVKLDAGEQQKQSQKYAAINTQISTVVENYKTYTPIKFLESVSRNFNL